MLSYLARRRIDAFSRKYSYDLSYARAILEASPRALWLYSRATELGRFRRGVPADVHAAAQLTAVLHEDCGPCVQLGVNLALQAGVPRETLEAVVAGRLDELPPECAQAVQFTRAVLARAPEADELREAIRRRYGDLGIVSLAFAMTAARIYPTVKYALGYGRSCSRVIVGDQTVIPVRAAPEPA